MQDRITIITGANSGIGKAAALKFAVAGHTVIMACRNIKKSKAVQDEIISVSKNERVYLKGVDMSSFASIAEFCTDLKSGFPKLDILINNAAYFNHGEDYQLSADHLEMTFATNVAGPFVMTNLLLPHLKKSDDARILNPASNIIKHFFSPTKEINFDNLEGIKHPNYKHSVYASYRDSKMALLMLSLKMAEEYKEFGIKVNSLQINGARMSKETLKKFKLMWRIIASIQNLYFPAPELMANHYLEICTLEKYRQTTGKLFNHKQEIMKVGPEKPKVTDILGSGSYATYATRKDVQERIWAMCMKWMWKVRSRKFNSLLL